VGELGRQTGIAGFLFSAGEFVALFEIAELIFQQDQLGVEEQVFVLIVGGVIGNGGIPGELFAGSAMRGGAAAGRAASAVARLPG
jgi:hypothetical protein